MGSTTNFSLPYPEGGDNIKDGGDNTDNIRIDLRDLALATDSSLQQVKEGAKVDRGAIPEGADLNTYEGTSYTGFWWSATSSRTSTLSGLPPELVESPAAFSLTVYPVASSSAQVIRTYRVAGIEEYMRSAGPSGGTGWTEWEQTAKLSDVPEESDASPAIQGFKQVPMGLTQPVNASATRSIANATFRFPVHVPTNVRRWRLHIENVNDRSATRYPNGDTTLSGIYVMQGDLATGEGTSTPVQIAATSDLPADGSDWASSWTTFTSQALSPGTDYLVSIGINAPSTSEVASDNWAACWAGANPSSVSTQTALTEDTKAPFLVWIEAEIDNDVPVVAMVGDSNTSAIGSSRPIYNSTLGYYARRVGAWPVMYGHSGTTIQSWMSADQYKWQKWEHLTKPDAMIVALGNNNVYSSSATLEGLTADYRTLTEMLTATQTRTVITATIPPRSNQTDETLRRDLNDRMKLNSVQVGGLGGVDYTDLSAAVSSDDDNLNAEYDVDGIHYNAAGQKAVADAITEPAFPDPARVKFEEDAGRTAFAWDPINRRNQLIYGDTGVRNVRDLWAETSTSGRVELIRENYTVTLIVYGTPRESGMNTQITVPSGFRPPNSVLFPDGFWDGEDGTSERVVVGSNGSVQFVGASGTTLDATLRWRTNEAWPDTLPGTAVGTIPYQ